MCYTKTSGMVQRYWIMGPGPSHVWRGTALLNYGAGAIADKSPSLEGLLFLSSKFFNCTKMETVPKMRLLGWSIQPLYSYNIKHSRKSRVLFSTSKQKTRPRIRYAAVLYLECPNYMLCTQSMSRQHIHHTKYPLRLHQKPFMAILSINGIT